MQQVVNKYQDRVAFVTIYGREAHAEIIPKQFVPLDYDQRRSRADQHLTMMRLALVEPRLKEILLIDDLPNRVGSLYGNGSHSGFIIDLEGRIVHSAGHLEWEAFDALLEELLSNQKTFSGSS